MVRKRKIPARKHHGVRDPLRQLEEREKKLSKVVDSPPAQADDQRVSYKFAQFKRTVETVKSGKKVKREQYGREDKPKETPHRQKAKKNISGNQFRNIKQFSGEDDRDYLRRVNRVTAESVREAQYEAKYGVNVLRNPKTGEITIQKQPKNEIDELLKQKQKEQRVSKSSRGRGKKKAVATVAKLLDPKTAKQLIKRAIKEGDEEERKESNIPVQEYKHDLIKFGEIVHAPPTISTLPRKAEKSETVPRPGKKQNLLLQSLMNKDHVVTASPKVNQAKVSTSGGSVSKAQMRGKRKELPVATRSMLDNERSKLVDIYRQLKKAKAQA